MVGVLVVPSATVGLLRGLAVLKAYKAICVDLRAAGVGLLKGELQLLFRDLNCKPQSALSAHTSPEVRAIGQRHAQPLLARMRSLKRWFWAIVAVGATAVISFPHVWATMTK